MALHTANSTCKNWHLIFSYQFWLNSFEFSMEVLYCTEELSVFLTAVADHKALHMLTGRDRSVNPEVKYGGRSPKFFGAPWHVWGNAVLIGGDPPPPPAWDSNTRALFVSKERRHLLVPPCVNPSCRRRYNQLATPHTLHATQHFNLAAPHPSNNEVYSLAWKSYFSKCQKQCLPFLQ
jgi:hypothetical protein